MCESLSRILSRQTKAAHPDENAKPYFPYSSAAIQSSTAVLVGFPVNSYI
jgi:hypothetical protein